MKYATQKTMLGNYINKMFVTFSGLQKLDSTLWVIGRETLEQNKSLIYKNLRTSEYYKCIEIFAFLLLEVIC